MRKQCHGFSLIELVVVIVVIGALVSTVVPRLNIDQFRDTGGFQQGIAMIRLGQKMAITSGCNVNVSLTSATCNLTFLGACAGAISNPSTGDANFCLDSDPGVSPAVNFNFNTIGAPTAGQETVNFGNGRVVTVEANTGFVHE